MTFMFLLVILGTTHKRAPAGFAGLAIGLGTHADPPDQHSGDEHVGQPGAQHRHRAVRRGLGPAAAVDVLGGAGVGAALAGFTYKAVFEGWVKDPVPRATAALSVCLKPAFRRFARRTVQPVAARQGEMRSVRARRLAIMR